MQMVEVAVLAMVIVGVVSATKVVRVNDAFVSSDRGGSRWSIGTAAVEMSFALDGGRFMLVSCLNRLTTPAREYIGEQAAVDLLPSENSVFPDIYLVEQAWSKELTSGVSADPSSDDLRLTVKKGDMIGFAMSRRDHIGVNWVTRVDYSDGESYTSSNDTSLDQGPVWYYFMHVGGSGFLEQMSLTAGEGDSKTRVPQGGTYYYPAWSRGPSANGKMLYSTDYQAVRAWRAPKDGVVSISGTAKGQGDGTVEVRVLRIAEKVGGSPSADAAGIRWRSESTSAERVTVGGRPAAQLDWILSSTEFEGLRVMLHVQAYPGTSILRLWVEVKNSGSKPVKPGFFPQLFSMGVQGDGLVHHWMIGGNNADDQGMLKSAKVGSTYHQAGEKR